MPIGYVYAPITLEHDTGTDPESAARLIAIMDNLTRSGLLSRLAPIVPQRATEDDLCRVHSAAMVTRVRRACEQGGGILEADTVVSAQSYEAALYAAGNTIAATHAVLAADVQAAFALVRPPGHHASASEVAGFCLFNNVAIAAAWALAEGGVERLAIVDFDAHHGNGTAAILGHDPRVLFVSLHQYPYYPGTGHWRERGQPTLAGYGSALNIPLPPGVGDAGYGEAFERLVLPMVRRHEPQLILVSAGYDAHWSDPLTWMLLSVEGYHRMVDALHRLAHECCQDRLVLALEGGYDLDALKHGVAATFSALLELPYADPLGPAREAEQPVGELIQQIARYHHL
jgi:acetoin utilization deacetylase AcuC-like enzyme